MNAPDIDPCASCGLPDVEMGSDVSAHWNSPFGTQIVAWTCSSACADQLEGKRRPSGVLSLA